MSQIIHKVIGANPIKFGTAVIKTGKEQYQKVDNREEPTQRTEAQVESRYGERFDDPTYYG